MEMTSAASHKRSLASPAPSLGYERLSVGLTSLALPGSAESWINPD